MFFGLNKICSDLKGPIAAVGHRGDYTVYEENTSKAIKMACANGVDLVEIDVQLTSENDLVCFHNPYVELGCSERSRVNDVSSNDMVKRGYPLLHTVLVWLRLKYPDVAVILDCKHSNSLRIEKFSEQVGVSRLLNTRVGVYANNPKSIIRLRSDHPDMVLLKGTTSVGVVGKFDDYVDGYMIGGNAVVTDSVEKAHSNSKFVLAHKGGLSKYNWKQFLDYCISIHCDGCLCGDTSVFR